MQAEAFFFRLEFPRFPLGFNSLRIVIKQSTVYLNLCFMNFTHFGIFLIFVAMIS